MFRRTLLQLLFLTTALFVLASNTAVGQNPPPPLNPSGGDFSQAPLTQVPSGVILVKGAEPSASDRSTPLPEEGSVVRNVYQNRYLGLSFSLPSDWLESFKGPPPSDSGMYVLANLLPSASFKGPAKGTLLLSAQDMFFTRSPARNASDLIEYDRAHLQPYYEVERGPVEFTLAGHPFSRFDYQSRVAQLHWVVLATEIRCHAVQFVLNSRDPELLENLVRGLDHMQLPAVAGAATASGGGDSPLCIRDYASGPNVINRVDPVLTDRRLGAIPVRIIIDRRGRVRHVHVLRAFPEQAARITEALMQWRFKPHMLDGEPTEVETGIVFGSQPWPQPARTASDDARDTN